MIIEEFPPKSQFWGFSAEIAIFRRFPPKSQFLGIFRRNRNFWGFSAEIAIFGDFPPKSQISAVFRRNRNFWGYLKIFRHFRRIHNFWGYLKIFRHFRLPPARSARFTHLASLASLHLATLALHTLTPLASSSQRIQRSRAQGHEGFNQNNRKSSIFNCSHFLSEFKEKRRKKERKGGKRQFIVASSNQRIQRSRAQGHEGGRASIKTQQLTTARSARFPPTRYARFTTARSARFPQLTQLHQFPTTSPHSLQSTQP
jgi:hypothetical protein